MGISTRTHWRRRTVIFVLVAALAALAGVTSAVAGATQTTFTTTAAFDFNQAFNPEKTWVSDGIFHWANAPLSAPFVSGPFAGGTVSIVSDGNFNLTTFENETHGSFVVATPLGTWEGRYADRNKDGVLSGNAVGRSSDGTMLKLKYSATGPFVGIVIITYHATILDPPS